jgi:hypothetical protein
MALDENLRTRLVRVLSTLEDRGTLGPRLSGDAVRLWNRLARFRKMALAPQEIDLDALELACYALQLPTRQARGIVAGRLGRTNLRERCEQSAELLVSLLASDIEEPLLDRTTRILLEIPSRPTTIEEAKLLADAVNLDDFGVTGLMIQSMQLALIGDGVADLVVASDKREQYGYWEARLKDGFHYEPVRQIARKRLESARHVAKLLAGELSEDR